MIKLLFMYIFITCFPAVWSLEGSVYVYICMCVCMYVCMYVHPVDIGVLYMHVIIECLITEK
jgi:hypothetical protein